MYSSSLGYLQAVQSKKDILDIFCLYNMFCLKFSIFVCGFIWLHNLDTANSTKSKRGVDCTSTTQGDLSAPWGGELTGTRTWAYSIIPW